MTTLQQKVTSDGMDLWTRNFLYIDKQYD